MNLKQCQACKRELFGRIDKKFCDAPCRADFHNQNRPCNERYISDIQRIVRHNRRILKTLCPQGKATVRKEILDQMGYDYQHFSGLYKTSHGHYYLVYDYAFSPMWERDIKKVLIVNRQDYMDNLSFEIWKKPYQA